MSDVLAQALANGDRDAVAAALDAGASVEAKVEGRPLLAAACAAKAPQVALLALERGADVDAAGEDGWTPLLLAIAGLDLDHRARRVQVRRRLHGVEILVDDPAVVTRLLGSHPVGGAEALQAVAAALIDKADLTRTTPAGSTALLQAAARGVSGVVELLLGRDGVDVDAAQADGLTPLHLAVRHNREEVVRSLLAAGANVDATDRWGATPLHEAAEQGRLALARRLLVAGADASLGLVEAVGGHAQGATASQVAASRGFASLADLLGSADGTELDKARAVVALFDAVWVGRTKGVAQAVDGQPSLSERDARGRTALELAVALGKKKSVGVLAAADPEAAGPCLVAACADENTGMVKILLESGVSSNAVDGKGDRPLHRAAEGASRVIKPLLDHGADLEATDAAGRTPLLRATEAGDAAAAKKLVKAGADTTAVDSQGRSALHLAALAARKHRVVHWRKEGRIGKDRVSYEIIDGDFTYSNNGSLASIQPKDVLGVSRRLVPHHLDWLAYTDVVRELLRGGTQPTTTAERGCTPAHLWAAENSVDALRALQRAAGRTDLYRAADADGRLPVHAAAAGGAQASVLFFVREVDPGLLAATDAAGNAPLHLAALAGDALMVELLLGLGVDRSSENAAGQTAASAAASAGHQALGAVLRQA